MIGTSYIFLLPFIVEDVKQSNITGVFLPYEEAQQDKSYIYLKSNTPIENPNLKSTSTPKENYLITIAQIPEAFKEDYKKIITGKYSTISDNAKVRIIKGNKGFGKKQGIFIRNVFNKHPILKQEIYDKYSTESETGIREPELWDAIDEVLEPIQNEFLKL